MSKKQGKDEAVAEESAAVAPPKAERKASHKIHIVDIGMPISEPQPGYQHRHIDLQLKQEEVDALAGLRSGLINRGLKLADGKPIWTGADVVRWLLQELGNITSKDFNKTGG